MREDWIECTLGEILIIERGGSPRPIKEYITNEKNSINWIKIGDATNSTKYILNTVQKIKPSGLKKSREVFPGDLLLSNSMSFGRPYIMGIKGAIHDGWLVIRDNKYLNKDYLYYTLSSPTTYNQFSKKAKGSTVKNLNINLVSGVNIKIYPTVIQKAIVKKIEELFSSLDSGIADLEKAQAQLKIYRQAVLKKAFEGELTKDWREKQTELPSAEELLVQIKEERQKYYQQQLKDWEKAVQLWEKDGKKGTNSKKPNIYKNYNSPVRELSLGCPSNWLITCIGNTCSKTEYGSSSKSTITGRVPVLRMGNMQNGKIDWSDLKFTSDNDEIAKYLLKKGDVLFNRTNSPELVGKTVLYNGEYKAIFAGYLIRLNHIRSIVDGRYLNYFLNSHPAKVYGAYVKTDGVNQSNINGEKLSNYPIPIPSLKEQHQIVQEIESRLSVCDKIEKDIAESLEKANALRQSILKKAFEGTLLTEEEIAACKAHKDYEPASVLLEKIKEEKLTK